MRLVQGGSAMGDSLDLDIETPATQTQTEAEKEVEITEVGKLRKTFVLLTANL